MLNILFQDSDYVAIHKPAGLLVHRTNLDPHETEAAVQILRDQINAHVFPVHRLDRPTSGVLIFALSSNAAALMTQQFTDRLVQKKYIAVVRGHFEKEVDLDYPLKEELDEISDKKASQQTISKPAQTLFRPLAHVELPVAVDRYPSSRYSLIEAFPKTGRKHQIRRHLKHLDHPIIGDVNHGKDKHNKFFTENFNSKRLLLACTEISFLHPKSQIPTVIKTDLCDDYKSTLQKLGWNYHA